MLRASCRLVSLVATTKPNTVSARAYKTLPGGCYGLRIRNVTPLVADPDDVIRNRFQNANLLNLVEAYRWHGHKASDLDPLGLLEHSTPELSPHLYGFTEDRLDEKVKLLGIVGFKDGRETATVREVVAHLQETYCGKFGIEFEHLPDPRERKWFADAVETKKFATVDAERLKSVGRTIMRSEAFDQFMQRKFPQVKRYGAEGAESYLAAVDEIMRLANDRGVHDVVICMPHRGRLNFLVDRMDLNPALIFRKIRGLPEFPDGSRCTGDVLSHLRKSVHIDYGNARPLLASLITNPSHLEACNPVALGKTRAKQMMLSDGDYKNDPNCQLGDKVLCLEIHGDAAFCAQGVVMESLSLSQLPHYTVGGTCHLIVNNQLGFTTPADRARSSQYSSDIGKMIDTPVIHVNGDDVEAVLHAARLAVEYRMKFRKDVIVDLLCFRRHGHNEVDDPSMTQPVMYRRITARKSIPETFVAKLAEQNIVTTLQAEQWRAEWTEKLEQSLAGLSTFKPAPMNLAGNWEGLIEPQAGVTTHVDTGVRVDELRKIGLQSVQFPEGFNVHPRLLKLHIEARAKRLNGTKTSDSTIDWATAEAMAFGSLLKDGSHVRISGQDVGRGTFSQRHAMLVDQSTDISYVPLNDLGENVKGKLEIANSNLSEFSVLGFEYGASLQSPHSLIIWEAQFGDFFNGAQIIIDTFISSGESKWLLQSGLVMLLPHGYDGAGPEHSSCRMERFLQLTDSAFDGRSDGDHVNMSFCIPSTPAQYFHLLRRQLKRPFRKPLVIASPKTLLRLRACQSSLDEMGPNTRFQPVLEDPVFASADKSEVKRVLLCSGKIFYELSDDARRNKATTALVRVEELCPFPGAEIEAVLAEYPADAEIVWCQEEPMNQGAYSFMAPRLESLLNKKIRCISRPVLAVPAVSVAKWHAQEVETLFNAALVF